MEYHTSKDDVVAKVAAIYANIFNRDMIELIKAAKKIAVQLISIVQKENVLNLCKELAYIYKVVNAALKEIETPQRGPSKSIESIIGQLSNCQMAAETKQLSLLYETTIGSLVNTVQGTSISSVAFNEFMPKVQAVKNSILSLNSFFLSSKDQQELHYKSLLKDLKSKRQELDMPRRYSISIVLHLIVYLIDTVGDKPTKSSLWHFDLSLLSSSSWTNCESYSMLELPTNSTEYATVLDILKKSTGQSFEHSISSIELVWNKNLQRLFEGKMDILRQRSKKPDFQPTWQLETCQSSRLQVMRRFSDYIAHFPNQPESVHVVPLWHGTSYKIAKEICETGFAALSKTDEGYFGKGLYFTNSAEYAIRVYSATDQTAVLCWAAVGNIYPVIHGDREHLVNTGKYKNYDSYYVPVAPINPNNPQEVSFLPPTDSSIPPKYDEYVIHDEAQVFPRYIVRFAQRPSTKIVEPVKQDAKLWKVDAVCTWLTSLELTKDYSDIIKENGVNGKVLLTMTTEDWKELGIKTFGDVRLIQTALKELL